MTNKKTSNGQNSTPERHFSMGIAYLSGENRDINKAVQFITEAAEAGLAEAQDKLVEIYMYTEDQPHNAIKWLEKYLQTLKADTEHRIATEDVYFGRLYLLGNMYRDVNRLEEAIESFSKVVEFCEKEYGSKSIDVLRTKTDLIESNLRYAGHCMDSNESELCAKAKDIIETNRKEVLCVLETAMTVLGEKHEDVMMLIEEFSHYRDKGLVYCSEIDDNGEFKTSTAMAKYLDDSHITLLKEIRKDILSDNENVLDKDPESLVASALAVKYNWFLGKKELAKQLIDKYVSNLENATVITNEHGWSAERIADEKKKLTEVSKKWMHYTIR